MTSQKTSTTRRAAPRKSAAAEPVRPMTADETVHLRGRKKLDRTAWRAEGDIDGLRAASVEWVRIDGVYYPLGDLVS
jgi:hypothetical protein